MTTTWIDVSIPLTPGVTAWPGDTPFEAERVASVAAGDGANVTCLAMSAHVGTHVDAPRHYLDVGAGVDELPLEAAIGPALVVDAGDRAAVDAALLEGLGLGAGDRILLRTANSARRWWREPFRTDFVALTDAAAALLAERRVGLLGVDGPSVGPVGPVGDRVHRALLAAGVWLVEGLDLGAVLPGRCELICLPLRVVGADGAPARVVLRPI